MSISNSNDRLPNIPFGKIWLLMGISLVLFTGGWDWFWFSKKVVPLPDDDEKLWAYHRRRVAKEGNKSVVLIGSSRMQQGIDQHKFSELTGLNTIQLAMVGESPLPVLQNLAEDESFRGIVISDFGEHLVYFAEISQKSIKWGDEWIKAYQDSKTADDFEFWLRGYGRYLIAHPNLGKNPPEILQKMITGEAFEGRTFERLGETHPTFFDRTLIFDLDKLLSQEDKEKVIELVRKTTINGVKFYVEQSPPKPEKFVEMVTKIEGYVQKIQSRGGRVIIVNFPMSGEVESLTQNAFPRKQFWDVLVANTTARTIHYKDFPQLQFNCTDYSHLDAKDTPKFTEELVKIIVSDLQK